MTNRFDAQDAFTTPLRLAGYTWAEAYKAWVAHKARQPHWRWPSYNEVQDALDEG